MKNKNVFTGLFAGTFRLIIAGNQLATASANLPPIITACSFIMDKNAVEAARAAISKTEASISSMRTAKSYAEFQSAWSDFLLATSRVYTKLDQGAKTNSKSVAWFGHQKHQRRSDPLLCYVWHARNADEHGLKLVTQHTPGSLGIGSTGATHIKKLQISGRNIEAETSGDPLLITITPDSARLMPVVDRGDTYNPPTAHQGAPIKDQSPVGIAQLTVTYLHSMIEGAAKLA